MPCAHNMMPKDGQLHTCTCCFRNFRDGNCIETEQDNLALKPPEAPYICPSCDDAERIVKRKKGENLHRSPIQPSDGIERKCSICFGVWRDAMRIADYKPRKFMKIRIIARGMDTFEDFRIVDMESGNELPVVAFEVLPSTCDDPLLRARLVIYLHGGLDIEAAAEVTVRAKMGEDDPTAAGRDIERKIRTAHFEESGGICPHCGRDDGTHPTNHVEGWPCSGKAVPI